MASTRRLLRPTLIVIVSIVILLVLAGSILSYYAQREFVKRLKAENGTIGSASVNLFTRSVSIRDFEITYAGDSLSTQTPHHARIARISLSGVSIYHLILDKKIHVNRILLTDGEITYNQKQEKRKGKANATKLPFRGIDIGHLALEDIATHIVSDSIPTYDGLLTIRLSNIELKTEADTISDYSIREIEIAMEKIKIHDTNKLYHTSIASFQFNSKEGVIRVDSFTLTPIPGKFEFAHQVGKQTDRFTFSLPLLEIKGFNFKQLKDSVVAARSIRIAHPNLDVFRDKRVVFKNPIKPLPMQMLKEISFGIEVDSIILQKASITYEEFPEEGTSSGKIDFTNLNGVILNVNNRGYYNSSKYMLVSASARMMKSGQLDVSFHLPLQEGLPYHAKGHLDGLNLPDMNPVLEGAASARIESGKLNRMNFDFVYDEYSSAGTLDVNYEDLKMTSLNKEDHTINQFKTFLANTIIRKDKDETVDKEKRTGEIKFERDRRKSIINLWVKSLMSGLKSAVLPAAANTSKKPEKKDDKKSNKKK